MKFIKAILFVALIASTLTLGIDRKKFKKNKKFTLKTKAATTSSSTSTSTSSTEPAPASSNTKVADEVAKATELIKETGKLDDVLDLTYDVRIIFGEDKPDEDTLCTLSSGSVKSPTGNATLGLTLNCKDPKGIFKTLVVNEKDASRLIPFRSTSGYGWANPIRGKRRIFFVFNAGQEKYYKATMRFDGCIDNAAQHRLAHLLSNNTFKAKELINSLKGLSIDNCGKYNNNKKGSEGALKGKPGMEEQIKILEGDCKALDSDMKAITDEIPVNEKKIEQLEMELAKLRQKNSDLSATFKEKTAIKGAKQGTIATLKANIEKAVSIKEEFDKNMKEYNDKFDKSSKALGAVALGIGGQAKVDAAVKACKGGLVNDSQKLFAGIVS